MFVRASIFFILALPSLLMLTASVPALALNESPQTFTLDGHLTITGTTNPLLDSAAKITVQVLNPTGTCLLYEEQQTVNTRDSNGYFNIQVGSLTGSGKRTVNDPGRSMIQIFQNTSGIVANNVPGQTCAGGAYTPTPGAIRYFRVIVTPSATNLADTLSPDIVVDSVPSALVAQSVQGLERSSILQTAVSASTALTQSNLEALFTTPAYTNLQAILGGNFMKTDSSGASLPSYAADPAGVSNGDIWFDTTTNEIKYKTAGGVQTVGASGGGSISSLTVGSSMSINGTVAGTISSSGTIDLSNTGVAAGTYAKVTVDTKGRVTAGTVSLVEADIPNLTSAGKVSGNTITSGTISGSAGVNTSGNLITTGTVSGLTVQATNLRVYNGTNYVELVAPTLAGIVNFTLPDNDGNPGDVLTSNGSGVLSWAPSSSTLAGDVSGLSSATSVDKIKGKAVTAASVSGQIMIYDGTAWTNNVVSGDATLAHNGIFTLNRVPVSKGGTNTATFGNNRIIASNGTGSALVDFTCPLNQVITFDASGNSACANVSSLITALVNGGNTTGGTMSVGSNDNHALQFKTNNTVAMTISQSGNVGFGIETPQASVHAINNYTALRGRAIQNNSNVLFLEGQTNPSIGLKLDTAFGQVNDNFSLRFMANTTNPTEIEFARIGGTYTNNTNAAFSGYLSFLTATGASLAERMRITEGGNVGIGTTTPGTAALAISGSNYAPLRVSTTTDNIVDFIAASATGRAAISLTGRNGTNPWFIHTGSSDTSLYIKWGNNINAGTERVAVKSTGEVGIGTTSPAEMLDVAGAIKLGNTTAANAGTIRWDGVAFQGYNGSAWANFVPNPPSSGACGTTNTYSSAGTHVYTVPASFGSITIRVWGAGGAGGSANTGTVSTNGGPSSVSSLGLFAGGGGAGGSAGAGATSTVFGAAGSASGGTVNTTGNPGTAADASLTGAGGSAPNGGAGGISVSGNSSGSAGLAPGGGGGGSSNSTANSRAAGGGSGGYVEKTFTPATLTPGTTIADIVVGAGGTAAYGGVGGTGRVSIACSIAGAAAANDRGIMYLDGGQYTTATTFIFDSAGQLGLGTATPGAKLDVTDSSTTTSAIIVPRAGNFTGTTVNGMIRYNTSTSLFEFRENGNWVNYTTVSDERLKTNVVPVDQGLYLVSQLNPVFYDWNPNNPKSDGFAKKHQVGFIAQEVEKVLPEVVNKGEDDYRSVEYGKIVSVVVAAVKELYQKLLGVDAKVQALNEQTARQEREIASLKEQTQATTAAKDEEIKKLKQENQAFKDYFCAKDPSAAFCQH